MGALVISSLAFGEQLCFGEQLFFFGPKEQGKPGTRLFISSFLMYKIQVAVYLLKLKYTTIIGSNSKPQQTAGFFFGYYATSQSFALLNSPMGLSSKTER